METEQKRTEQKGTEPMFDKNSCCQECIHAKYLPAKINAPAEDCYPAEDWCEEDSENSGTHDGCK